VYGDWMALSALVSYFTVTDLGMNSAAINALTAAYARRDLTRYRQLQGSAIVFYVGMALSVSLLFGVLIVVFPVPLWIGIRHIPPTSAAVIAWLLAARILWQMPSAQLWNVYRTTGNLGATQWLWNLQSMGLFAITAIVLVFQGGAQQLAIWGATPMILVSVGAWFSLRRSYAELLPRLSDVRLAGLQELLRPSLLFAFIMLSMALTLQGPVLLLSRALGGAAVALFVTTRTLSNVIRQMVSPLQLALWPELTRLDAVGDEPALRVGHRLLAFGSVALSAAVGGALWFEGASVIALWTHGKLVPDVWLLRILLIATVLQSSWLPSSLFLMASNRHRRLALANTASAVITLAAISLLIPPLGLLAAPFGALTGDILACCHFVVKDACYTLKEDYARFAARLWFGVAATACAAWGAGYLGHSLAVGPAPIRWLQVGILTTVAAALTAWNLTLQKNERTHLSNFGKSRWSALRPANAELPA
jgi:O-antigen/teichoic acid export membrane protein